MLKTISAFGVKHICSSVVSSKLDEKWSAEGLSRLRERVEKHGIKLEMVPLPLKISTPYWLFPETMNVWLAPE